MKERMKELAGITAAVVVLWAFVGMFASSDTAYQEAATHYGIYRDYRADVETYETFAQAATGDDLRDALLLGDRPDAGSEWLRSACAWKRVSVAAGEWQWSPDKWFTRLYLGLPSEEECQ